MPTKPIIKKIILAVFIGLLIAAPLTSLAATPDDKPTDCDWLPPDIFCGLTKGFNFISIQVGYLISYVASFLISLASGIIQTIINASTQIISSELVATGFKITLDIANLGFVLAIIVIAFTTMLRLSGYETKQLLQKLIVAAVLVNFSFLIAGVIIDASNVFGNFFLQAASPGDITKFGDNLANALNVQKLLNIAPNPSDSLGGGVLKVGASYLSTLASVAATAIFSVLLVITFFAIALMLLLRYVWITFLLIVMPLAWLAYTFPSFSEYFGRWWKNFVKWNLFYPIVALFLYLGVESSQQMGAVVSSGALKGTALTAATKITGIPQDTLTVFIQIIVQIFLMMGGLYAASELGITGADSALKMAAGAKGRILGVAGKATGAPGAYRAARGATTGIGIAAGGALAGGAAKVLGNKWVSWFPGAKGAAANLYNAAAARKDFVAAQQKEEFSKDSTDALLTKFRAYTPDKTKRAAIVNEIAKRGLSDKVDPKRLDSYLADAKDLGATRDIEDNAPDLAPQIANYEKVLSEAQKRNPGINKENFQPDSTEFKQMAIQMAMDKFRPGKTDTLGAGAIQKIARFFRKEHLDRLGKEGDIPQLLAVAKAAREISRTEPNHPLVQYTIENPAMQQLNLRPEYNEILSEIKKERERPRTPSI